ncbi:MAG: nuclear transport factor 2 family protein [Rhizobiaceae bacterium]|nr:nuclear transport factor 2 family protein [Rhizobiaceae bacterium]
MVERSDIERAVQAIYQARDGNDLDGLMALTHPDCGFRIVGSDRLGQMTQRAAGPESLRGTLGALMGIWDFSGLRTISVHIDGNTAFVHRSGPVRFVPADRTIETEIVDKLTFRDGALVEIEEFIDTLQAAEIAGLVEFA